MGERRDSKGHGDVREEAAPAARKDPRRDSYQMSMPAVVAELTRELTKLKMRVAELEKDVEREKAGRLEAEAALARRNDTRSERDGRGDEIASRMTRELRGQRKSTIPLNAAPPSTPPRGSVSPVAKTQPPPRSENGRSEHATKRIAVVTRLPSQSPPPERKR